MRMYIGVLLLAGACLLAGSCRTARGNIAICELGPFPAALRARIEAAIQRAYGLRVVDLPPLSVPKRFYSAVKSPRYSADSMLVLLKAQLPDSIDRIIGLTSVDIFTAKKDESGRPMLPASKYAVWGIFGLGERPGRSCVASLYRLRSEDSSLLTERAVKVSVHEVGHTLGLPHCPDKKCVMTSAAERLSTVDAAGSSLCAACRKRL